MTSTRLLAGPTPHDLHRAIVSGAVEVVFQPIVRMPSRAVVAVEALARWRSPEWGAVSPATFVPLAEASGLVTALGTAVMRRALEQAPALRQAFGDGLLLTVNVSGAELLAPGAVERIVGTAAAAGWPPGRLVVEVTESTVAADDPRAAATLRALRAEGVGVAVDDFGTGYSSLARLDAVPADFLKLDAAFTAGVASSRRRAAMLRALVDLASALDLQLIAEGVEHPEQSFVLTRMGCPLVQGYLYGRPAAAGDVADLGGAPATGGGPGRTSAAVPAPRRASSPPRAPG